MLMLVTSDNFLQLFFGWEGVGLCSYLLINFWFTRLQANKSAIKAMIVNRVGDFGLAIAIFSIFCVLGSLLIFHISAGIQTLIDDYIHDHVLFLISATYLRVTVLFLFKTLFLIFIC